MTGQQQFFAIFTALVFLAVVFELVRRRRLRIEFSWLWTLTGMAVLLVVLRYDWLEELTTAIGAVLPTTTLFIFAILFLMLVGILLSIHLSALTAQVKNLTQELALLRYKLEETQEENQRLHGIANGVAPGGPEDKHHD